MGLEQKDQTKISDKFVDHVSTDYRPICTAQILPKTVAYNVGKLQAGCMRQFYRQKLCSVNRPYGISESISRFFLHSRKLIQIFYKGFVDQSSGIETPYKIEMFPLGYFLNVHDVRQSLS